MAKRYFELRQGKSDKFWEIELSGTSFNVRWGRRGTQGQGNSKSFASDEEAQKAHDKLVAQKLREGYAEKTAETALTAPSPAPATAKSRPPASPHRNRRPL